MFTANGYARSFTNHSGRSNSIIKPTVTQPNVWRTLPHIANVSAAVARLLQPLRIGIAHRPETAINRLFMKPKAPIMRPGVMSKSSIMEAWEGAGLTL
ncbi:unnamed protein product [Schistocephalus solidus]|uniref:Uncharacterized protein n=1 Tax=Schistocephalus solidus TaxID=70667 RepID=A0A183SEC0_SCHSO|nr:unnamed protein product [Schistocephalus solidus]